ncbi:MAG: DUF2905 domain-containing protein [Candidatus Omnitrophica bacterium]|nr:DUF2905 domain-containing protein [Candidatus Omnitrophota bacterium]
MNPLPELGKILIFFGIFSLLIGTFLLLTGKVPWLGHLPGDIVVQKKNFHFYFPLATSLLLSLLLTLLFSLFGKK